MITAAQAREKTKERLRVLAEEFILNYTGLPIQNAIDNGRFFTKVPFDGKSCSDANTEVLGEKVVELLEEKGFVIRKPVVNTYLYSPAITEKEYRGSSISSLVEKYFNNSYTSVVCQFVEEEKMDIEELKALIADIENSCKQ